jgi:uncharacterized alpha-E superfamily protein
MTQPKEQQATLEVMLGMVKTETLDLDFLHEVGRRKSIRRLIEDKTRPGSLVKCVMSWTCAGE